MSQKCSSCRFFFLLYSSCCFLKFYTKLILPEIHYFCKAFFWREGRSGSRKRMTWVRHSRAQEVRKEGAAGIGAGKAESKGSGWREGSAESRSEAWGMGSARCGHDAATLKAAPHGQPVKRLPQPLTDVRRFNHFCLRPFFD